MPPTATITEHLYLWALTLADGTTKTVVGSNMATVIGRQPVTSAVRGAAVATPAPVVSALTPNTAVLGSPNFTLHVGGTGFTPGAVIVFAGLEEPTTFVSPTEVTTLINMAVWAGPDTLPVSVRSAAGQDSNSLPFTFTVTARDRGDEQRRDEGRRDR